MLNASPSTDDSRENMTSALPANILQALQQPVVTFDEHNRIIWLNHAAESFFATSRSILLCQKLQDLFAADSAVLELVRSARHQNCPRTEYRLVICPLRSKSEHEADVFATPVDEIGGAVSLLLQVRTMADRIDRQLVSREAARSASGLASMLSHEIKNPLSGIRGAAQLLEQTVGNEEQQLTRLIRDEADRIVKLVDRVGLLGDMQPIQRQPINIHQILDRVALLTKSSVANRIRFVEKYDPSLPNVSGDHDQLVQVFLNLVKNAAEALGTGATGTTEVSDPCITISTAFRPGIKMSIPGSRAKISLPLEIAVHDNGPGVPPGMNTILFDPFVTGKSQGSGLGLALVAKIISDHGGIVDCQSKPNDTCFRVFLPMAARGDPAFHSSIAIREEPAI